MAPGLSADTRAVEMVVTSNKASRGRTRVRNSAKLQVTKLHMKSYPPRWGGVPKGWGTGCGRVVRERERERAGCAGRERARASAGAEEVRAVGLSAQKTLFLGPCRAGWDVYFAFVLTRTHSECSLSLSNPKGLRMGTALTLPPKKTAHISHQSQLIQTGRYT